MENKANNQKNSINKININNSQQKEEDTSIMSLLWEGIANIFNSDANKNQKNINNNNNKKQYCTCKITHSEDYCDNIYSLMQMIKNNDIDSKQNKKLYENLLNVHEKSLDLNGENLRQINKDLNRTYPSNSIFKNERILKKLKNVLRAFSNYDNSIKYFQGMNFIVGFFYIIVKNISHFGFLLHLLKSMICVRFL